MKYIAEVAKVVERVLEDCPEARNSDNELYIRVIALYNRKALSAPFGYVMSNRKALGIPQFESVRRSRQKIQAEREDLRGTKEVTDARFESWKAVIRYV